MHIDGAGIDQNLLKPETVRQMTRTGGNPYYARGWFVDKTGRMSHGGSLPGCTAMLALTPDHFATAALTNNQDRSEGSKRWLGRTESLTLTIPSEPRLESANHPRERNGALLGVHTESVRRYRLTRADI